MDAGEWIGRGILAVAAVSVGLGLLGWAKVALIDRDEQARADGAPIVGLIATVLLIWGLGAILDPTKETMRLVGIVSIGVLGGTLLGYNLRRS